MQIFYYFILLNYKLVSVTCCIAILVDRLTDSSNSWIVHAKEK